MTQFDSWRIEKVFTLRSVWTQGLVWYALFNLIRKTAQVIELEMLEQNDSDNLRNEIQSPNVVRPVSTASTASSKYSVERDGNRTQTRR